MRLFPFISFAFLSSITAALCQPVEDLDFDSYARACKDALEAGQAIEFPEWLQCMDGDRLSITSIKHEDGIPAQTPKDSRFFTADTRCLNPPLLEISEGGIGQCVPNARFLLTRITKTGVAKKKWPYAAFLCRNYKYRSEDSLKSDPQFDDVALILYDPESAATCFFQRVADPDLIDSEVPLGDTGFEDVESISGADVPSPFTPKGKEFWYAPKEVKDINCARCHDANPFIRSPYLDQIKKLALPRRRSGSPYDIVQIDYFGDRWKEKNQYLDIAGSRKRGEPAACLSCHGFGLGRTSSTFTRFSAGELAPGQESKTWRDTHWMPTPIPDRWDVSDWEAAYEEAVRLITDCHKKPVPDECEHKALYGE